MPRSNNGKRHIIVAVDYLTKWVEAKAVKDVTAKRVATFLFDQICCRFGIPLVIISDRGPGFRSEMVQVLVDKLKIQHRFSSPYYPQCNGLVESTNAQIMKMLSKYVSKNPEDWDEGLNRCLWEY